MVGEASEDTAIVNSLDSVGVLSNDHFWEAEYFFETRHRARCWVIWRPCSRSFVAVFEWKNFFSSTFSKINSLYVFHCQELDRLQNFLEKKYGLNIQQQELSGKGWNWGKTEFEGSDLISRLWRPQNFKNIILFSDVCLVVVLRWKEPIQICLLVVFVASPVAQAFACSLSCRSCSVHTQNIFAGSEMRFEVGSKSSFEIPLSNVSQCSLARDEVTLEFHQNDDSELSLMEMRFYIPPSQDDDIDRVKVRPPGERWIFKGFVLSFAVPAYSALFK